MSDPLPWRKSRHSFANGNCVEAASWRKNTRSAALECVEAGAGPRVVGVRDTKESGLANRTVIEFSAQSWREFTGRVKNGVL